MNCVKPNKKYKDYCESDTLFRIRKLLIFPVIGMLVVSCGDDVVVPEYDVVEFYGAAPPEITSFVPEIISPDGNETLTIEGKAFKEGLKISIGQVECKVESVNETTAICITSPSAPGVYPLTVTNLDNATFTSPLQIKVSEVPKVLSIAPNNGPLFGKQTLTIQGEHFSEQGKVFIGSKECQNLTFVSSQVVSCLLPDAETAGKVSVSYENNLQIKCQECTDFHYNAVPIVTSVTSSIPSSGLKSFTVNGKHFLEKTQIMIGTEECIKVSYVSPEQLTCEAPKGEAGAKDVTVISPDGQSASLPSSTEQFADPVLLTSKPDFSRLSGGEFVTITGQNLRKNMVVLMGQKECKSLTYVNNSTLICETPDNFAGNYDVSIVDTGVTNETFAFPQFFSYNELPQIKSFSPLELKANEKSLITLTGQFFVDQPVIQIGDKPCLNVSLKSSTEVQCEAPSLSSGSYSILLVNPDTQSTELASGPRYVSVPVATSLTPSSGRLSGGERLIITGSNFAEGLTIKIGSEQCTNLIVESDTELSCQIPASTSGTYNVEVSDVFGRSSTLTDAYTYNPIPTIATVSPSSGKTAGGNLLTISGSGFLKDLTVTIGGEACGSLVRLSSTQVTCTSPSHTKGTKELVLLNPDTQKVVLSSGFEFVPPPTLSSISPTSGRLSGTNTLTILGENFLENPIIKIGSQNCLTPTVVSSTEINCQAPPAAAGTYDLYLENQDLDTQNVTLSSAYSYNTMPTISSVSPDFGEDTLETDIVIMGSGFLSNPSVAIGSKQCGSIVLISDTEIRCKAQPNEEGAYGVTITNFDTQSVTLNSAFNYHVKPRVLSISPDSGPLAGGTTVNIGGENFRAGASVDIGGLACTSVTVLDAESLTCTLPDMGSSGGFKDVTVTNSSTLSGSLADAYKYQSFPSVLTVSPSSGYQSGNTVLTITGEDFRAGITIDISGTECTLLTLVSSSQLTCRTTAAGSDGLFAVSVENVDGQSAQKLNAYEFVAAPTITSIAPQGAALAGGATLTITGTKFRAGATVEIGGETCANPVTVSADTITCEVPAKTLGTYAVEVTNSDSQQATFNTPGLVYNPFPTISSIVPAFGSTEGGTSITINGQGFLTGATVTIAGNPCTVGAIASDGTSLTCTSSSGPAGNYDVVLTNTDSQNVTESSGFEYILPPTLTSITPDFGPEDGTPNTSVTIDGANFRTGIAVQIGGIDCAPSPANFVDSTEINCQAPALTAGTHDVVVTNSDGQVRTLSAAYETYPSPTVSSISTSLAPGLPMSGGAITITGTNFVTDRSPTQVSVGASSCTSVAVTNATTITCVAPLQSTAGTYDVTVTNPDGQVFTLADSVEYFAAPAMSGTVTLASSTTVGRVRQASPPAVDIEGTGLLHVTTVQIDGENCTSITALANEVTCTPPTKSTPGAKSIALTDKWGQVATGSASLYYLEKPTFISATPASAKTSGGTSITISGNYLHSGVSVEIDGVDCAVNSGSSTFYDPDSPANPSSVVCTTGTGSSGGLKDIVLTNTAVNDGQSVTASNAFTLIDGPTITSVQVSAGAAEGGLIGGQTVTIIGTGFVNSPSSPTITIGGDTCASLNYISSTQITCVAPNKTSASLTVATSYDLVLTNGDLESQTVTATDAFTYFPPASIVSVSPTGPYAQSGSTSVPALTFTSDSNENFERIASISIGGVDCSINTSTATTVECTRPVTGLSSGSHDVIATDSFGQASAAFSITYNALPVINTVDIATAPVSPSGVTTIKLTGSNFLEAPTVTVGGVACSVNTATDSATNIDCDIATSGRSAGAATILLTNTDQQSVSRSDLFSYIAAPTVLSLQNPSQGNAAELTTAGGESVTITGNGFIDGPGLSVKLGSSEAVCPRFRRSVHINDIERLET